MFLSEVALGKPYRITHDDPTLCEPPAGYDSVLACGRTEPGELGAGGLWQLWGCAAHRAEGREARSQVSHGAGVSLAQDPAQDEELLLDGKKVLVCQGKPIPMSAYKKSSFSQSEYLIYKESQCRLRYLVQLRF